MPVGRGDGVKSVVFCTLPSFARAKRPRWRPVGLNNRLLRSHGKLGDCEQSIKMAADLNFGVFVFISRG